MTFVEIFVTRGVLSPEQRHRLGERIIAMVLGGEGMAAGPEENAPQAVIDAAMSLAQVVVQEPDVWFTGGPAGSVPDSPRYVVRVTLPGAWRKEMSEHVITSVTRAVAEAEDDPERLYREPRLWVQVIGVPEGGYGTRGMVMTSPDLVRMITDPWRGSLTGGVAALDVAPGMAIDPVCGMTVALEEATYTLERDGATYAFCSAGCRQVFEQDLQA